VTPELTLFLERELRSDHAGETGAGSAAAVVVARRM
jgi:hypothetical protein